MSSNTIDNFLKNNTYSKKPLKQTIKESYSFIIVSILIFLLTIFITALETNDFSQFKNEKLYKRIIINYIFIGLIIRCTREYTGVHKKICKNSIKYYV